DGSFEESVDLTAAAVQAFSPFRDINGVSDALLKTSTYLQNSQKSDGGFGNIFSSSWAIQAMNALGASWTSGGKTTEDYLGAEQSLDGAALPSLDNTLQYRQNRIWATSYAIPAALGKDWGDIMQSVLKPENKNNTSNFSSGTSSGTSSGILNIENLKKPDSPVICPPGNLFSTETGKACAAFSSDNIKKTDSLVVCPSGDLFSTETGKACNIFSSATPTSLPKIEPKIPKEPAPAFVSLKNEPDEPKEKKENQKPENLANQNINQNTATALMAITDSPAQKTEAPKRNWFLRFLDKIFSIF
ncbi:MAG: hypothetical protein AABX32_04400, partial [Nanoarchaeota archaeon]